MAKAIELLDPRRMTDEELLHAADILLKEINNRLSRAAKYFSLLERYRGCSIEITWVKNKVGAKYWYPYLKCRDGSSIYLGNKPGLKHLVERTKSLSWLRRRYLEATRTIREAIHAIRDAKIILEAEKELREAEQEAQELDKATRKARRKR